MWRVILRWIGPELPRTAEQGDDVLLGVVTLVIVTVSLPFLFGLLWAP